MDALRARGDAIVRKIKIKMILYMWQLVALYHDSNSRSHDISGETSGLAKPKLSHRQDQTKESGHCKLV